MEPYLRLVNFLRSRTQEARVAQTIIVLGIIGVCGGLSAIWASDKPQLQAAIVGGIFTLIAAAGGAMIVFYQLRRQGQNTIDANRRSELMKLKKDIYEQADLVIAKAETAQVALRSLADRFVREIKAIQGTPTFVPSASYEKFDQAYDLCDEASAAMSALVDKWRIAEPSMDVLVSPLFWARQDASSAYFRFMELVLDPLPRKQGDKHSISSDKPSQAELSKIDAARGEFFKALTILNFFSHDLRRELQNLLLVDLFERRVRYRAPSEDAPVVLHCDNTKELQDYVDAQKLRFERERS